MNNGDLDPLYKNRPVTLWVEDALTRDYLTAAWDVPSKIQLLVAGSSSGVSTLANSARKSGYKSVYGLCDRDFGATNYSTWSKGTPVFRLQMHEIENALLDPSALHSALVVLGRQRSEADIRKRLIQEASAACWGMALGSTFAWMRRTLCRDFPESPDLMNVSDRRAAVAHILHSAWWKTHRPAFPVTFTTAAVRQELRRAYAAYQRDLGSNAFLTTFAGKELLGRCLSWLVHNGPVPHPTDSDLAMAVGNAQRATGTVPPEVSTLKNLL